METLIELEYWKHVNSAKEHTREIIGNLFAEFAGKHRVDVWVGSFRKFRLRHVSFAIQPPAILSLRISNTRCAVGITQTEVEICGLNDMTSWVMIM